MAKGNIEVVEVDDWNNLRYTINKYFYHWPSYIFRGQAQDNWLLEPTLARVIKNIKSNDLETLTAEHLNRFRLEIRGRRGDNPKQLKENEIWALGQHFGLYTPLLDWTESPWVAIYFALTSAEKSETGKRVLWALCIDNISAHNENYRKEKNVDSNKMQLEIIKPDIDENIRLVNQRGLFTKTYLINDIEKWVTNGGEIGDNVTLYKIIFPDILKDKILMYLNLMNINHSSLFPDLFGSSIYTNGRLLLTDKIEELQEKELKGLHNDDDFDY